MGKASREKGKRGEREVATKLREHGFEGRRGQQYCGLEGDADVVGIPGYHIEVKRTEQLRLRDAMAQAFADADTGEVPVVVHRRSRQPWVAIMDFDDWLELVRRAENV
jgi:Holliday junction resolvase